MTWNLEWFFDDSKRDNSSDLAKEKSSPNRGEWNWRRDAVAKSVAKAQPSVLALQEIEGQQVLWYLTRALDRNHGLKYREFEIDGTDRFTEQDVGLLATHPTSVFGVMRGNLTNEMREDDRFGSVSKHLFAVIDIPVGRGKETILLVNLHLRARPEGESTRKKQVASVNAWLNRFTQMMGKQSPNIIVLGDFNTEHNAGEVRRGSEIDLLISRMTPTKSDDLVDLHERIPVGERQTHMIPGKQFDRILVSRSLITDTPGRPDLVIRDVAVRRDLVIQEQPDEPQAHWDAYWKMPQSERDLSDHYPVMATFEIR